MILENQKHLFGIPGDVTYLNCAYMSPLLTSVNQAAIEGLATRSHPWKLTTNEWFGQAEILRNLFAGIIHADKENIALVPSVSYGIAIAAKNIPLTASQHIIVIDQQYPSNVYAWRELSASTGAAIVTIQRQPGQSWTEAIIEKINIHTGVIAIPNCHWTDGSVLDLERISVEAKKVNAKLVIDGSQSVGAYPIDVNKIKPDFLVTVGYKWLLGAYGLGYLYADKKYCESGSSIEFSWLNKSGSEDFTKLVDYVDEYRPGARRFDAGEFPAFINIPMAIAALTQIKAWGVDNIQQTLSALTEEIENKAKAAGLETPDRNSRVGHLIGIKFSSEQVALLKQQLPENGVYVSFRGTNMRVAPHLYNTKDDVEHLFRIINAR